MRSSKQRIQRPSRREMLRYAGAATGLGLLGCGDGDEPAASAADTFDVVVLADTHIIDSFYEGPQGNAEDTASIFHTSERLEAARLQIHAIRPRIERAFILGDVVHNYPSTNWDFYFQNDTRFDEAKRILDGFEMPIHPGWGNHDYDVPNLSREFTHDLIRAKFGVEPYYVVEHEGWSFVHLNNFLGATHDPASASFDTGTGSFGETQLQWLEAELQRGRPTFLFLHYMLPLVAETEVADLGLLPLLRKYQDTIRMVLAGHTHRWIKTFEYAFGPRHWVVSSTRYDPDAFLVIRCDKRAGTYELLNEDRVTWGSWATEPYP